MRQTILAAAIALALVGTGCGQAVQQAVEKSAGVQVTNGGQGVTIQGQDGQKVTISGSVPDALKGFPVPDGFTPDKDGYSSISSKDGALSVGSWSGTATSQVVFDYYSKTMPQQGWTEQVTSKTDAGGLLSYTKGDSQATITISTTDKTAKISVMTGKFVATPTAAASAATSQNTSAGAAPTPTAAKVTAAKAVATDTPAPPSLSATGSVPAELKDIPVPDGFKVVADSSARVSASGQPSMATVRWFGTTSLADVTAFYKKSMTGGWTEVTFMEADTGFVAAYTSAKDPKISLAISGSKTDAGTEVGAVLTISP